MFVEAQTFLLLAPEVVLTLAATAIFVGGAFVRNRKMWVAAALASYLAAFAALAFSGSPWFAGVVDSGPLTVDPLSLGLRWLAVGAGFILTLAISQPASDELASEMLGALMLVMVGVMLTASANELVLLFVGLEMISVPTYVLLYLGRKDRGAGEATMKYFYLSLLSSALLLYGFSFLYGIGGTTLIVGNSHQPGIREALAGGAAAAGNAALLHLAPLALVLVVAGLGFKLAAAPFQFYAPDVYQGTTNANAGILAVAPKVAGIAALIRLLLLILPVESVDAGKLAQFAWQLGLALSVLTMTIGNICALWQNNIRRLLAYSSIAHSGYLLIGFSVAAANIAGLPGEPAAGGVTAMLFYVAVYSLATMGAFSALAYLGSAEREVNTVDELSGLGKSQPFTAAALAIFMFSLAGIPPLAGFFGKLTLFVGAVKLAVSADGPMSAWFCALAIIGALNAAIAAAYYLRIIAVMYFQPVTTETPAQGGPGALAAAVLCAVLVVVAGFLPGSLVALASKSEAGLTRPSAPAPAVAQIPRPLAPWKPDLRPVRDVRH